MKIDVKCKPELDPNFIPAALWNRAYQQLTEECADAEDVSIALVRPDKTCTVYSTRILPDEETQTLLYLERILKFLLWQRGGCKIPT